MVDKSTSGHCPDHGEFFGTECPACEDGLEADDSDDGFYLIYEVNAWQEYDSMVVKAIVQGLEKATSIYWQLEKDYNSEPNDWHFKMGYLPSDHEMTDDGDILRQLEDRIPQPKETKF